MPKEKLIALLNKGLELEHAARAQYLSHAKVVSGANAEGIIARLVEIAGDEQKHEGMFRDCIEILGGVPSIKMAVGHPATGTEQILQVNLKDEHDATDFYRNILKELDAIKAELKYEYEYVEHKLRHVIIDEQEHASELKTLLGQ
ncbi:MAG: ferritin-like domain-containing protein [Candidatus ainarchaeum sp.]|nr:ferritin-like domain-containing protein [Candidatus ainarchaeum sp.]